MSCWLLVVGCWLLVVGCWLLVVGCWLLVVGCWLLVVGCWLLSQSAYEYAGVILRLSCLNEQPTTSNQQLYRLY
jgi:uncharacterized membrane protein